MKKSILLIFAIVMLMSSVSCDNKTKKDHGHSGAQQTESHQQEQPVSQQKDEHGQESDKALQLNNGNLWKANIETTEGIETMKNLMISFSKQENMEVNSNLKQDLEKEFGTIIAKCTMTGEAHTQLHKYLLPMRDLFGGLAAPDLATRKASFDKINTHLKAYSKYFN